MSEKTLHIRKKLNTIFSENTTFCYFTILYYIIYTSIDYVSPNNIGTSNA